MTMVITKALLGGRGHGGGGGGGEGESIRAQHPSHAQLSAHFLLDHAQLRIELPSTKTECDYLYGSIKKRSHTQKSHPKW